MARTVQGIIDYGTEVHAVADAEIRKLRRDPSEILTRAIQPAIWLVLFGEVMAQVRGLTSGNGSYLDFLAPGILAQSVLFAAIFYGIAAIWERDLGVLHRYMVSPAPRSALVLGKALSSALRGLTQAVVVYADKSAAKEKEAGSLGALVHKLWIVVGVLAVGFIVFLVVKDVVLPSLAAEYPANKVLTGAYRIATSLTSAHTVAIPPSTPPTP